ncbi:unnamed protein product, partial [Tetraodon nigroviridis]
MRYSCLHGNRLRPVLLLTPPGKDSSSFTLRVHACPPPGFFKPNRFHPQRNNVRTDWYTGLETPQSERSEPPTPLYNSSFLGDLLPRAHLQFLSAVSSQCSEFANGVILLKVWLRQRELDQGMGGFSGFLASMIMAYLLTTHRISNTMSAYQLLRNSLNFLASTDLTVNGISLAKNPDSTAPSLAEFHHFFQAVFVDPSGHLNMCADMTACTYKQLQHEASLSMQFWDNPTVDGFHSLLMTPKPMIRTSDHVFQLCEVVKLQSSCKKLNLLSELMDHNGDYVHTVLPYILSLLQRGLGQRISLLTHSLSPDPEWSVEKEAPKFKSQPPLSFGLLLNPEVATSVLERGPPADSPKAAEFRQLWGSRSELRRFQDGEITEAVLWDGKSMIQKRMIPKQIITHLLQLHADIPESCLRYIGAVVDDVITLGQEVPSSGEEESLLVVKSYDDLSRKLWQLEGLPLSVTAVQGAHPALRYTQVKFHALKTLCCYKISHLLIFNCSLQVFPPQPTKWDYSFFNREKASGSLVPKPSKPCPAYVAPITGRLSVPHPGGVSPRASGAAGERERRGDADCAGQRRGSGFGDDHRSQAVAHQHAARAPAAAHVFRGSVPLGQALAGRSAPERRRDGRDSRPAALLRWASCVSFICSPPLTGRNSPLIVNLNTQLTAADYTEIKNDFMASRESLPVMFIATPQDKKASMWTKRAPSIQMLQRVGALAAESLKVLERQLMDGEQIQDVKVVLRPPLDMYDVLIHLNPKQVPLLSQAVDPPILNFSRGVISGAVGPAGGALPVIDYNPVSLYLAELRDAFGDLALFFCDPHGGTVIAVLWKPKAFVPIPFKTSQVSARSAKVTGENVSTSPNVEAILEDFKIMGKDLVKSVEPRTEKWA